MYGRKRKFGSALAIGLALALAVPVIASGIKLLDGKPAVEKAPPGENRVHYRCLTSRLAPRYNAQQQRGPRWSLPSSASVAAVSDTMHILVMRFNFQQETPDDPNTSGNGLMDMRDTLAFLDSAGHLIDPPPHNASYFNAHLEALKTYYETVSDSHLTLSWDIFPVDADSAYQLPLPMRDYGKCTNDLDTVIAGLELYFEDCIKVADADSAIVFKNYDSYFLFHAGSDRQNDLGVRGVEPTCSDLFTGYISFRDSVLVDAGGPDSVRIQNALIIPETANQDNRATALNAVLAHEFGHQLGLPDLYNTANFVTSLGDFALMDNNGMNHPVEFSVYPRIGSVFGTMPIYPCAWSRAYLGWVEVVDIRNGADLKVHAAELFNEGDSTIHKIYRIPITEKEYYLIENRNQELTGLQTAILADSITSVIQGPGDIVIGGGETTGVATREYDTRLPGTGLLIYHVDEGVAGLDYDGDGVVNFEDNQLQWDKDRRFIRLIEADGVINLSGWYQAGFGSERDMFSDEGGRATSFTPETAPPTVDNSGNQTHVYVEDIHRFRFTVGDTSDYLPLDSIMVFDVTTKKLAPGFPLRAGSPDVPLSPIAADLDGDGRDEIIVVSDSLVSVFTPTGGNFLREYTQCFTCTTYTDFATASIYPEPGRPHDLALFTMIRDGDTSTTITATPVVAEYGDSVKYVVVGFERPGGVGLVEMYAPADTNSDGLADLVQFSRVNTLGVPIAMAFARGYGTGSTAVGKLYVLDDEGNVYRKDSLSTAQPVRFQLDITTPQGICLLGQELLVLADDKSETRIYYGFGGNSGSIRSRRLLDYYEYGPILVDVDRKSDSLPELIAFSSIGKAIIVSIDTSGGNFSFKLAAQRSTGYSFTANPIAGDIDADGLPDIVIGGAGSVYAFNHDLILKTGFPMQINDRIPDDRVIAAPIMANLDISVRPEIVLSMLSGNIYSFGYELTPGFPLSGGEFGFGSPLVIADTVQGQGYLGYLGADGWFYLWDVSVDTRYDYWPMAGHDATGSYRFDPSKLSARKEYAAVFPEEKFYNYPNPVESGRTTIRYFLGQDAVSVSLIIYDLSGTRVDQLPGAPSDQGVREIEWVCSGVTPGVYRCVIEVTFANRSINAFTDIAVIR